MILKSYYLEAKVHSYKVAMATLFESTNKLGKSRCTPKFICYLAKVQYKSFTLRILFRPQSLVYAFVSSVV